MLTLLLVLLKQFTKITPDKGTETLERLQVELLQLVKRLQRLPPIRGRKLGSLDKYSLTSE